MEIRVWFLLLIVGSAHGIESPEYSVVDKESEFEVRLYKESSWMSASSDELSFQKATAFGFHRLFQYIEGANLNWSRISMTKPILTSIVPDTGPLHSSSYSIQLYLPTKFQASPPLPLPELDLRPVIRPSGCVAVGKFSGFARDSNIVKEAKKLAISLSRSSWANLTDAVGENAYSIAQYNAPFRKIGRVNEVWFDVGCKSPGSVVAY